MAIDTSLHSGPPDEIRRGDITFNRSERHPVQWGSGRPVGGGELSGTVEAVKVLNPESDDPTLLVKGTFTIDICRNVVRCSLARWRPSFGRWLPADPETIVKATITKQNGQLRIDCPELWAAVERRKGATHG